MRVQYSECGIEAFSAYGHVYRRVAWTGGDTPDKADKARRLFREIRRAFFREQVAECGGLGLWECAGTSAMDRARIFWNRASLDAHRTITDGQSRPAYR